MLHIARDFYALVMSEGRVFIAFFTEVEGINYSGYFRRRTRCVASDNDRIEELSR